METHLDDILSIYFKSFSSRYYYISKIPKSNSTAKNSDLCEVLCSKLLKWACFETGPFQCSGVHPLFFGTVAIHSLTDFSLPLLSLAKIWQYSQPSSINSHNWNSLTHYCLNSFLRSFSGHSLR